MLYEKELDDAPLVIFENVQSIPKIGVPGVIIPRTADTRALLCVENPQQCLMIAARSGLGRVLVFAHNGYVSTFQSPIDSKFQPFVNNCIKWLVRDEYVTDEQVVRIDDIESMKNVPGNVKILLWDGHCDKSEIFTNDLKEYVLNGGAMVCGSTPWGWLQLNEGKPLQDFPFQKFCSSLGIELTDGYIDNDSLDQLPVRHDLLTYKNMNEVRNRLTAEPNNGEYLALIEHMEKVVPEFQLNNRVSRNYWEGDY
ncbi:unnamed protein product [Didymodactylos carnosus]|uniref:Uncharacterized protein n=2 Tax=Didymodactylos carnosus TaxID=1234261 RepID=A0A815BL21_9BILA|nr:unnamed protein product [Didymodactylos carnosus]CAF4059556.1 unnamed protein product [Didymodactylos carnosus]